MNRIEHLLKNKESKILSIFFTAGYPELNDTAKIIKAIEKSGADLIEIGMPFSDPLADGPVIQHTSEVALKNGMSLNLLFEQLKAIRKEVKIPLILMGYLNPVFKFGIERFAEKCAEVGVDGLILPDLPMDEYLSEFKAIFDKHDLINVFLITPQTPDERILEIDAHSRGFIYMVSSASTTGTKSGKQAGQQAYFDRVKKLKLKTPCIIGFGINNKETFEYASQNAQGAIIGSAFVKMLEATKDLEKGVDEFIHSILD